MNTLVCRNLRPDYSSPDGRLTRAEFPAVACAGGAWAPLAATGGRLVAGRGRSIGLVTDGATVAQPVTLDAEPLAVFDTGEGVIAVMTPEGCRRFRVCGDTLAPLDSIDAGDLAASVVCVDAPAAVAYVPDLELGKTYDSGRELDRADKSRLTSYACDVYRALDAAARAQGCMAHPAVARLCFCRADGSVAAHSAPVLLTSPSAAPDAGLLAFESQDRRTVAGGAREIPVWRVRLDLPALPAEIASVQLVMAPIMQCADPSATGALVSELGAGGHFCTVRLPAGAAALYGAGGTAGAAARMAACLDDCGAVAASISGPFGQPRSVTVALNLAGDADADNTTVRRLLSAALSEGADSALAAVLPPNSFTATAMCRAGAATLWAGLRAVPFGGFGPAAYAVTTVDAAWRGYVRVTMSDGSAVVRTGSGASGAPLRLSPVLSFPSAGARSMEIGLDITGRGTYRLSVPLTRCAGAAMACYTDPALRPVTPAGADAYAEPAADAAPAAMNGVIAVASGADPLTLRSAVKVSCGAVAAISPARFGQSSWDFGRSRFYVFGSAGIHSVAVDKALSAISVNLLDSRGCTSAAVATPEGIFALAGSDLVRVEGSRVTTIECGADAESLLYDAARHELWCVPRGGDVRVLCPRLRWRAYTLGLEGADAARTLATAWGSWLAVGDDIRVLGATCEPRGLLPVFYQAELTPLPGGYRLRKSVIVDMHGRVAGLRVSVGRSHHLAQVARPDVSVTVTGTIKAPLRLPWAGPGQRRCILTVSGEAAQSFSFRER